MAARKTKTPSETAPPAKSPPRRRKTNAPEPNGVAKSYPTPDQIRVRAYELYLARGAGHGNDRDDWFAAERELSAALVRSN